MVSGSTDRTVRLWRAGVGRRTGVGLHPWFEEHVRLGTMAGWVQSLSFGVTHKVGDLGSVYAADSTGAALCFTPRADKDAPGRMAFVQDGGVRPFNALLDRAIIQVLLIAPNQKP